MSSSRSPSPTTSPLSSAADVWTVDGFQLSSAAHRAKLASHAVAGLMVLSGGLLLAMIGGGDGGACTVT